MSCDCTSYLVKTVACGASFGSYTLIKPCACGSQLWTDNKNVKYGFSCIASCIYIASRMHTASLVIAVSLVNAVSKFVWCLSLF